MDATWAEAERPTKAEPRRRQRSKPEVVIQELPPVPSEMPSAEPSIRDLEKKFRRAKLELLLKVIGILVGGSSAAIGGGKVIWDAVIGREPPPPPADIRCPPWEDDKAPRGALCTRIHLLEGWVGELQAAERARRKQEADARRMLEQEAPKLKPRN